MPTYKPEDLFVGLYQLLKTPQEMFEVYENYQQMFSMFDYLSKRGFVLDVKEFGDEPPDPNYILTGGRLLKYFFSLHSDRIIADDQANEFAPIFYVQIFSHLPDDDINGTDIKDLLQKDNSFWELIKTMFDYSTLMTPLLKQELEKLHDQHPELTDKNKIQLRDLQALTFAYKPFTKKELEPLFKICREKETAPTKYFELIYSAVKTAKQAVPKELEPIKEEPLRTKQHIPSILSLALQSICYPTDKVNCHLWGNLRIGKQTTLKAESDRDRAKGKRADIIVMLNFEELDGVKISRPLTIFDKWVFVAVANLVNEGQYIITPTQIYRAMGNKSKLNQTDKEKIIESLSILVRARVFIDNTTEAKLYGYDKIKGDFALLKADIVTAYVDGQLTEGALQVAEVPKLFQFSIDRGQVTTVPIKLLESPKNKTNANMILEDYLIRRISQMNNNNKKVPNKILLSTLCEQCEITNSKQRSRLIKDKLPALLDHYVKTGYIKSYTLDGKSITIISPTKK